MRSAAKIEKIDKGSPAERAGLKPDMIISRVDGHTIEDVLDWRWRTTGDSINLFVSNQKGEEGYITIDRDPDEDWGIDFSESLFDGVRQCENTCSFCFVKQLPTDSRRSLRIRDDDYRMSFLQGTFATLTNLNSEDISRIIEQRITPLRVSLHAVSAEVRAKLMGKNAPRGIAHLEKLLHEGISVHVQIVLVPGVNDGEELSKTLMWAYRLAGVENVGIVPLGYTKHQNVFTRSFDSPSEAREVIEQVEQFQQRARAERGYSWVYIADEFYRNAYQDNLLDMLPSALHYGSYDLFEDGIGIVRSFVDDWEQSAALITRYKEEMRQRERSVHLVVGTAQMAFLKPLVEEANIGTYLRIRPIENHYFGGNVTVTGLLCGCDIIDSIKHLERGEVVAIPSLIFNSDGITLDDMRLEDIQTSVEASVIVVSCNASEYLKEILEHINS